MSKSVLNKGVVDKMFEKHYETEESDDNILIDKNFVKEEDIIKE